MVLAGTRRFAVEHLTNRPPARRVIFAWTDRSAECVTASATGALSAKPDAVRLRPHKPRKPSEGSIERSTDLICYCSSADTNASAVLW